MRLPDLTGNSFEIRQFTANDGQTMRGLFASEHIPLGSELLRERPLFTLAHQSHLLSTFNNLCEADKELFMSYKDSFNSEPTIAGIFQTNVYNTGSNGKLGFLPIISLMNRSCKVNVTIRAIGDVEVVTAVKDIHKDEQICHSYTDVLMPFEDRIERLRMRFSFICQCDLCHSCRQNPEIRKMTDDNRSRLQIYYDLFPKLVSMPSKVLDLTPKRLHLLTVEGLCHHKATAYFDAAQILMNHPTYFRKGIEYTQCAYDNSKLFLVKILRVASSMHNICPCLECQLNVYESRPFVLRSLYEQRCRVRTGLVRTRCKRTQTRAGAINKI
ncbi:hypothetical protein GEMRC1_004908 [Eukaryota sp. GEM-RC1]